MKKYFVGAVFSVFILCSPSLVMAQTSGLTGAQIQAILSLLSSFGADSTVVAKVNAVLTGSAPPPPAQSFCYNFQNDLTVGNGGDILGADVMALKRALSISGIAKSSCISGIAKSSCFFDEDTAAAVIAFQAKHGLRQTGYVGPMTRAKLNALYGCGNTQPVLPVPPTVQPAPTISRIEPASAPVGSTVTVYGSNFTAGSYISVPADEGGKIIIKPSSYSSTTLSFIVPFSMSSRSYIAGHVIRVVTNDLTSNSVSLEVPIVPAIDGAGMCIVRNGYTSIPGAFANDNGPGYSKVSRTGVSTLDALQLQCTQETYTSLMNAFCRENQGPVQRQVALVDPSSGRVTSTGCSTLGCDYVSCPTSPSTAAPTISRIEPASAPVGSTVTVYGSNFTAGSYISFPNEGDGLGGVFTINPSSYSSTTLSFVIPWRMEFRTYVLQVASKVSDLKSNSVQLTVPVTLPPQTNPVVISQFGVSQQPPGKLSFSWNSNLRETDISQYGGGGYGGGCSIEGLTQNRVAVYVTNGFKGASGSIIYTPTVGTTTYTLLCTSGAKDGSPSAIRRLTTSYASAPKFSIGDRVQTTIANLDVVSYGSTGMKRGAQPLNARGVIIGGPEKGDEGFIWWNVNYDIGFDGWSADVGLKKIQTATSTTLR